MNTSFEPKSQAPTQHNSKRENQNSKAYPSRTIVHAKLEMTEPGDHDEQEADAVASAIMSGGKISRKISSGASGSSGIAVSQQMESQLSHLQGNGRQMPQSLRNMMESGFGRDFSQVRLHTDSEAASMSSSIHAKAFTHGNDIYFNHGQFSPETTEGQRLVAHELTHVVQETGKLGREDLYSHSQDIALVTNTLPTTCGDLSDKSKTKLDNIINTLDWHIDNYKMWRNCAFFNNDYTGTKNQEIPDINALLNDADIHSIFESNEYSSFECANNPNDKINNKHQEVVNYLRKGVGEERIKLFSEWMKYSTISSCIISELLGIAPIKEFVKHTYTIHVNFSADFSAGVGIVSVGVKYSSIIINYSNNLGMEWSVALSQTTVSVSAGISIPVSGNIGKAAGKNYCNSTAETYTWYSPGDFLSYSASLSDYAEVALPILSADGTFSGIRYLIKGKDDLTFNSSGLCISMGFGLKAGIGGTASLNASFLPEYQPSKPGVLSDITPRDNYLSYEEETLFKGSVYFDTGSFDLYSGSFMDENNRVIDQVVNTIINNYDSNLIDRITVYTQAHSSPLWKDASSAMQAEEKNRVLAQKRNESVYDSIVAQITENSQIMSSPAPIMSFVPQCIDHPALDVVDLSQSNRGSEEGLAKTNDPKNNSWNFRRVDIWVSCNRKIDNRILSNKPYSSM